MSYSTCTTYPSLLELVSSAETSIDTHIVHERLVESQNASHHGSHVYSVQRNLSADVRLYRFLVVP